MVNCKLAADIQRPKGLPDGNDQAYAANSCEPAQGFFYLRAWWNWQTRKSQELVAVTGRESSSLSVRTRKQGRRRTHE